MNNMEWEKKGLIFNVEKNSDWMYSHAAVPFAEHVKDDIFRIYFTTRDSKNRSHGAFIEVDIKNPKRILNISPEPIIKPGPLGSFDDSGTMPTCMVNFQNKKYLYYVGWSLGITVPFYFYIGMAENDGSNYQYKKISPVPILDRDKTDPYLTASPSIILENSVWKMWYVSCERWKIDESGHPKHFYNIKYAESKNGIEWIRPDIICIPFKNAEEYAISRPNVVRDKNHYKMFYSYRGGKATYRIGYAESNDGIHWTRKDDEIGIDLSSGGWDSEMIAYPFVFTHKDITYMLYNGNGYGRSGFGYAILKN
jgi:predicted GH43/DUF377 family glycosyl hydrolase